MEKLQRQKGFTLVELAIVLTIIGLLIGGILKGQQLIANARVTAQMSQFKAVEAALTTFSDTYAALPGDMKGASTRIQGCAICANGDANGIISSTGAAFAGTPGWGNVSGGENLNFWYELSAAGLLSGVSPAVGAVGFGNGLPSAKVSGGLVVAQMTGGTFAANAVPNGGVYVAVLGSTTGFTATAGGQAMTPGQAAQIDRKADDGNDTTGDIVGAGTANCTNAPTAALPYGYNEIVQGKDCNLWAKMQ